MWNGKLKAVTFSFDDGVLQDKRAIALLNKYNLKATFNLNSSLFGLKNEYEVGGKIIRRDKFLPTEIKELYKEHEVAVHTLTHAFLPQLADETVTWQVEEDRKTLSKLVGYDVVGMAYPCGGVNNDDRVAKLIKENTGVRYARTITLDPTFTPRKNLYRFDPTAFHKDFEKNYLLAEEFFKPESEGVFYIWGHAYEFDIDNSWDKFEQFCKFISGRDDVFYGTNKEILL